MEIVPVVILEASRFGILAAAKVPALMSKALCVWLASALPSSAVSMPDSFSESKVSPSVSMTLSVDVAG
ncbi:MAG: hypothetical protein PUB69_04115 [Desulfovibrionaceae bacterium]|nr:hypothetical protein [Desulfovibrionaceae bacterium]